MHLCASLSSQYFGVVGCSKLKYDDVFDHNPFDELAEFEFEGYNFLVHQPLVSLSFYSPNLQRKPLKNIPKKTENILEL